jgi:type II secretory pathway component PulK
MRLQNPNAGIGSPTLRDRRRRPGYVLIAVLLVVVVLSLAAYQFTEAMTSEHRAAVRTTDAAQARACAISGLHYAAGMLSDRDSFANILGGNPFDNTDKFTDVVCRPFPDNPRREGRFSLVCVINTGTSGSVSYETRYAVIDEGGKLNINALIAADPTGQMLHDALMTLPNMTEDIADAIVDWVDADDTPRANGAESSVYLSLPVPYRAKNGPIHTIDELLLVQGVTPQLLYGTDRNRNGQPDDDPNGGQQVDNTFRGWAEYLTPYGRELNLDSTGVPRQYLNQQSDSEDLPTLLSRLSGALGPDLANYILAYKLFSGTTISTTSTSGTTSGTISATGAASSSTGSMSVTVQVSGTTGSNNSNNNQQQVQATPDQLAQAVQTAIQNGQTSKKQVSKSVLSLLNTRVTLPAQQAQPGQPAPPTYIYDCPLNNSANLAQLLPLLMDKATATTVIELSPRVNINTAPREVLMALPGMTDTIADAIIGGRPTPSTTDQSYLTGTWPVVNNIMPIATFQQLEPYITGRTMVYRVQSIGYFGEGGPVARVEAVIDTNQGAPRFLFFRDLTDLDSPRGFEPPRK